MKVVLAGEGGQGVQAIAEILAKAAFYEGKHSTYIPNFGVEQRGGVSVAFVIVADEDVIYPKFSHADVAMIFSERSKERISTLINEKTKVYFGPDIKEGGIQTDMPSKTWNLVVLGKVNRENKIVKEESLIKAMDERFKSVFSKNPAIREMDLKAIQGE